MSRREIVPTNQKGGDVLKDDKWIARWVVPSSSGGGSYIVGQDKDGNYACSCPGWTRNVAKTCPRCARPIGRLAKNYCWTCKQEVEPTVERIKCKHIYEVEAGRAKTLTQATIARMLGKET